MLDALTARASCRRLWLFAVACCSSHAQQSESELFGAAVTIAEELADGGSNPSLLDSVLQGCEGLIESAGGIFTPTEEAILDLVWDPIRHFERTEEPFGTLHAHRVSFHVARVAGYREVPIERPEGEQGESESVRLKRIVVQCAERARHTALLRDIFGNPFRPVAFSPAWRTDTAVSLARGMYDSREFAAMPILADALQDAGCEDEQILHHCRDANQVHVRGCWVCDLVLGL
jgi:hypothetical protein